MLKKILFISFVFLTFLSKSQHRKLPVDDFEKMKKKELFELYEKYNLAIENNPNDAHNYMQRGWLRYFLNDTTNALTDLYQSVTINPKNPFYHYMYSYILIDKKEYETVISECDEALKLDRTFVDVLVMKGNALDQLKKYKEAQENYEKAIQIDSTYEDTFLQFATSYALQNNFEAGAGMVLRVLKQYPNSEDGLRYRAKFFMHLKQYNEAIKVADILIQSKRSEVEEYLLKTAAYDSLRNQEKACDCMYKLALKGFIDGYEYIMEKCPKEQQYKQIKINTLQLKAVELENKGLFTESMKLFNEIINLMPDSGNHYFNRGKLKRKMENHKGAIEDYLIAIKKSPSFSDSYVATGVSYTFLGNIEEAKKFYLKCMKIDPFNEIAYYNYADILVNNENNCKEAVFYYKFAIDIKPDYTKAYYWLGECYGQMGMNTEACKAFSIAEKLGEIRAISKRIWFCKL